MLPAGTYEFKLVTPMHDRNVIEIASKDKSAVDALVLAVPDERLTPAGTALITFEERAAGAPKAIRALFYPGDSYGQEFVYSKDRAAGLTKG